MILLTRLNGPVFALNPDLVERVDCTPDTVVTLVDGTKYLVAQSLPEFVALVRQYRASVVAEAQHLSSHPPISHPQAEPRRVEIFPDHPEHLPAQAGPDNVVQLHRRER